MDKEFKAFVKLLLEEFGFKFKKFEDAYSGMYTHNGYKYELIICGNRSIDLFYRVNNSVFEQICFSITGLHLSNDLLYLLSGSAFPGWEEVKDEFVGTIRFKGYGDLDNPYYLSDADARFEFERLFLKHTLPWFEKNKDIRGVRDTFRSSSNIFGTWHNTLFTGGCSFLPGGFYEVFFRDIIISRLLGDDMRPALEIYKEFYESQYEREWNKKRDGEIAWSPEKRKRHTDAFLLIVASIDNVSSSQWEKYRSDMGLILP